MARDHRVQQELVLQVAVRPVHFHAVETRLARVPRGLCETFGFIVRALDALGVGYLCLLEPNAKDAERGVQIRNVAETFRPMTAAPIIGNTGFDKAKANAILARPWRRRA
jgi:hypothetical protein